MAARRRLLPGMYRCGWSCGWSGCPECGIYTKAAMHRLTILANASIRSTRIVSGAVTRDTQRQRIPQSIMQRLLRRQALHPYDCRHQIFEFG
eukprot:365537-Chlamydomonas_euryale.AAC.6